MERVTLLSNHIIGSEPAAVERLRRHSGAVLEVSFAGWADWLPPLPRLVYQVTPAGRFEWLGESVTAEPELRIGVQLDRPALALARFLGGLRPEVTVAGNATLAADVHWLLDNLRWDFEDDLEQRLGPVAAHQLGRIVRVVADALRRLARGIGPEASAGGEAGTGGATPLLLAPSNPSTSGVGSSSSGPLRR